MKPGGQVMPQKAHIYLSPITNPDLWKSRVDFWDELYGVKVRAGAPGSIHTPYRRANSDWVTGPRLPLDDLHATARRQGELRHGGLRLCDHPRPVRCAADACPLQEKCVQ
jgi:hypothetical protein